MEFTMEYTGGGGAYAKGQVVTSPVRDTRNVTMNFAGNAKVTKVLEDFSHRIMTRYVTFRTA